MRVLFWGTSDFALPTLRALLDASDHEVVGVVTQPDRPAGRGRSVRATPVARAGAESGLRLLQPEKPRGDAFMEALAGLDPDVSVVAAYGEILTEHVLEAPRLGTLNVHASLLPALRGAAPINWAIIRGHRESGVTIIRLVRELDAGPILRQEAVGIGPRTTAGELFEELSGLGGRLLLETLEGLGAGTIEPREQDHDAATYAPKLGRDAARLDWSHSAAEVDRWIRGCDPWPAAWSVLGAEDDGASGGRRPSGGGGRSGGDLSVQLFDPRSVGSAEAARAVAAAAESGRGSVHDRPGAAPGTVLVADPREGLLAAAGQGAVWIGEVKPAGSRRMASAAWIRGRGARAGQRLR
ncbi:MAG TPA: methionyl-tRNA formyltransferase [Gemmatimonadota bacterium]|nr:methionyl-tRNA formyltransferase [Gemmatimonadota bacterium]